MEVYQRGGNNRQQDRSTRRQSARAACATPPWPFNSPSPTGKRRGGGHGQVQMAFPSSLPAFLDTFRKRTVAPIVSLSGCLSCISPILFLRNQYSVADRRRDGRRGALTADDSTRANLEQVVTVTIAQCDSLSIEEPNMISFDVAQEAFKNHFINVWLMPSHRVYSSDVISDTVSLLLEIETPRPHKCVKNRIGDLIPKAWLSWSPHARA